MMPRQVQIAVRMVWASIGLAVATSIASRLLGHTASPQLCGELLIYAVLCLLPYKLSKGSNGARLAFIALAAMSIGWLASGGYASLHIFELVADVVQIPLTAYTVFLLLRRDDAAWWFGRPANLA